MAKLTGKDTKYFVARTKADRDEDTLVRTNTFTGYPGGVDDFGQADAYDNLENAKQMKDWLNSAPPFIKQDYDYYVIQKDEDSFRVDDAGNPVEEPPTEEPAAE